MLDFDFDRSNPRSDEDWERLLENCLGESNPRIREKFALQAHYHLLMARPAEPASPRLVEIADAFFEIHGCDLDKSFLARAYERPEFRPHFLFMVSFASFTIGILAPIVKAGDAQTLEMVARASDCSPQVFFGNVLCLAACFDRLGLIEWARGFCEDPSAISVQHAIAEAERKSDIACIDALREAGFSPGPRMHGQAAFRNDRPDVIMALERYGQTFLADCVALGEGVRADSARAIRFMLEQRGLDPNVNSCSLLKLAIAHGAPRVLNALLAAGGDCSTNNFDCLKAAIGQPESSNGYRNRIENLELMLNASRPPQRVLVGLQVRARNVGDGEVMNLLNVTRLMQRHIDEPPDASDEILHSPGFGL